jgi:hypothetical protein
MTDLDKVRQWLGTYSGYDILSKFRVDYTDQIPSNGGIFPGGLVEVDRMEDVLGNVTVSSQYNFALYYVFYKADGDDAGAVGNADWIMDFQRWVQEQSVRGLAPRFGNTDDREIIQAQNGVLYDQGDEGVAVYMVQLSIRFKTFYEV